MNINRPSHGNQKTAILLLGTQIAIGGAQKVLLNQAGWLHEQGYPVTAAFLYDREGLCETWQKKYAFPIVNLNAWQMRGRDLRNLIKILPGLIRLYRLMRRGRFSALESFTHECNLLALPLAWLANIPIRLASHHGRIDRFPIYLERLHSWMVNQGLATYLVVVSERVCQDAIKEGVHPERIVIIPNGVQLPKSNPEEIQTIRHELGMREGEMLVLSVGRLSVQKAHTYLLQAIPAVLRRFPNTLFAIAGDGPLRKELETEAARLGIQERLRLLGMRGDVPRLLAAADIFALSSRSEGMPIALLEAMGMGTAVVASRVAGVNEVVQDGVHGLLTPSEDVPALAGALIRLLEDPELRKRLALAGYERVNQEFSLDKMCRRYAALLVPGEEFPWRSAGNG